MSDKKEILIESNPFETRFALMEGGRLAEFYVEKKKGRGITGNIYKGRVVRVLPGMQASFVDIGLERSAFLHAKEVLETVEFLEEERAAPRIQDLLRQGEEILVQVEKEPLGTKGARLTSYVALAGRYMVLMPTYDRVGISRRVSEERERRRLRDIVLDIKPRGYGFIIRTACEGRSREEIMADMGFLIKLWTGIQKKMETAPAPALLYEELDLTLRSIRDMYGPDVKRILIEPKGEYERAQRFITEFMPELGGAVELHTGEEPLFDVYGVDVELSNVLSRKSWLPSGGYLIIDQMEALTAIDVNTGKYVGRKSPEATIFKTNIEAALEVVRQLRLRNIGGIIVIDFIDMPKQSNRDKVFRTLRDALRKDKARTNILKISELGIVEMTRKRVRESIMQTLLESCPYCDGDGSVKAVDTVVTDIYRELLKELHRRRAAAVYASPRVAERLKEKDGVVDELKRRLGKRVTVKEVDTFRQEDYEIV
jgi:ribonuclease G